MNVERRFFVKICGLRDAANAQAATDAGADALGFILAPSKRQVAPSDIASIAASLDRSRSHPSIVGVLVNPDPGEVEAAVQTANLETVQLSGDESSQILDAIEVPVIKALRFAAETSFEDAVRQLDPWFSAPHPVARVIVEGHAPGSYGGTGTRADWDLVSKLALRYPVVLAGGLTPTNVGDAVRAVRPWGVDVSSGVEQGGEKQSSMISEFITEARSAWTALS